MTTSHNLTTGPSGRLVLAGDVEVLAANEVFVFGSKVRDPKEETHDYL